MGFKVQRTGQGESIRTAARRRKKKRKIEEAEQAAQMIMSTSWGREQLAVVVEQYGTLENYGRWLELEPVASWCIHALGWVTAKRIAEQKNHARHVTFRMKSRVARRWGPLMRASTVWRLLCLALPAKWIDEQLEGARWDHWTEPRVWRASFSVVEMGKLVDEALVRAKKKDKHG